MATKNLGKIVPKMATAEFDLTVVYHKLDVVPYNGCSYWSLVDDNVGNEPSNSPAYWSLVAQKGKDGGDYELPSATKFTLGGVIVGENLTVDSNGVLATNGVVTDSTLDSAIEQIETELATKASTDIATDSVNGLMSATDKAKLDTVETNANNYELPQATTNTLGGVKVGANLAITDGVIRGNYPNADISSDGLLSKEDKSKLNNIADNANNYVLPNATNSSLGGVIIGAGLNIEDGEVSANFSELETKVDANIKNQALQSDISDLNSNKYNNPIAINTTTDLNTFVDNGWYYFGLDVVVNNAPTSKGYLQNIEYGDTVVQYWYDSLNNLHMRSFSGTWSNWQELFTDVDLDNYFAKDPVFLNASVSNVVNANTLYRGSYIFTTDSTPSQYFLNMPSSNCNGSLVFIANTQMFFDNTNGKQYTRTTDGSTYAEWQQLVYSEDLNSYYKKTDTVANAEHADVAEQVVYEVIADSSVISDLLLLDNGGYIIENVNNIANIPSYENGKAVVKVIDDVIMYYGVNTKNSYIYSNNEWEEYYTNSYHPYADKLTNSRQIAISGVVSGSTTFNGGSDVSINTTITIPSGNGAYVCMTNGNNIVYQPSSNLSVGNAVKATKDNDGNVISTTYAKVNNLALVATSGAYSDLTGKPSIPTVNNAVLTIQQNGTTVKTFTANSSSNVTANITVPTKTSDLTNDNGYITNTNDCVHLTGNESISGTKYFDSPNNIISLVKRVTDYATEDTPTRNVYQHLAFQDKNNKNIAFVQYSSRTSYVRDLSLFVADSSGVFHGIQINTDKEFIPYTNNSYSLGSSSNKWLKVYSDDVVHTTGDETIADNKSFSKTIYRTADITTSAAEEVYRFTDTNATPCGSIYNRMYWYNNNVYNRHQAYNATSGKDMFVEVVSGNDGSGAINTGGSVTNNKNLTTVTANTGSTYVATMGWVNNPATSTNIVHRSGDETIAGTKTFSSTIVGNISGSSTSCTGNSVSATKLATGRTINIQDADGTNTGTAVTFNGTTNGVIKLPATIKAAITGNADTATKATQDASGNVITDTYATKSENALKANNADVVHTSGNETITGIKYFTKDIFNKNENTVVAETPTTNQYISYMFVDNNNDMLSSIQYANRANGTKDLTLYLKTADGSTLGVVLNTDKSFYPSQNNSYSLGTSSYKWSQLHCTEITTYTHNFQRNIYGNYGTFWRQDGSDLYLMLTASGDQTGGWTTARPIKVNLSSGICDINGNAATATKANALDSGGVGSSVTCYYLGSTDNPIINSASWSNTGSTSSVTAPARAIGFSYTPTVGAIYSGSYLASNLYGSGSMTNAVSSIGNPSLLQVKQNMSASVSGIRISSSQKFLCTTANTCTCTVTCASVSYTTTGTFTVNGSSSVSGSKSSFMRVQ